MLETMIDLGLAFIQTDFFWEAPLKNIDLFRNWMKKITSSPQIIILPETFSSGFTTHPEVCAEDMSGPSVNFMMETAREKNAIVTGSLMIRDNDKYFNRCISAMPDGSLSWYDKRHLFRMSDEYRIFTGGRKKLIITSGEWNIQPLVCYDLRFPVWTRNTFSEGKYEYDLLIFVANWPASRANAWKSLLVARAIENQAYVVGVNRIGKDGDGTIYSGESLVIDPKGKILLDASSDPGVYETVLNLDELRHFRQSFPVAHDWDTFRI
ncbi:MAG: nitrilase-related carbon-nitrogen hydrolase, partial [Syntrophothermus sp.]